MAEQKLGASSMAEFWAARGTTSEQAIADYLTEKGITEEDLKNDLDHPAIYRKTLTELGR